MSNSPDLALTFHFSWPIYRCGMTTIIIWIIWIIIWILLPEHSYNITIMRPFLCGGLRKPFTFLTFWHFSIYYTENYGIFKSLYTQKWKGRLLLFRILLQFCTITIVCNSPITWSDHEEVEVSKYIICRNHQYLLKPEIVAGPIIKNPHKHLSYFLACIPSHEKF